LISAGHPHSAITLIRAGLRAHPNDRDLMYFLALAYARGGNVGQAQRYLDDLLDLPELPVNLQVDALGLQGRLLKDRYRRSEDAERKKACAERAAQTYLKAYQLTSDL